MRATRLRSVAVSLAGPIALKAMGLSGLTAAGQLSFVLALPFLSRAFSPAEFGVFTIYLSMVNICGPIAGLKFETTLYSLAKREDARLTLALSLISMLIMTLVAGGLVVFLAERVSGSAGEAARTFGCVAPLGILMAGMWATSSAWAIRSDAIPTLAMARFLQPALMTVLQVAAGFAYLPGIALIVAHLVSHVTYTSFIFSRTLNAEDLRALVRIPGKALLKHARAQVQFPLFAMPAQVGTLLASNLPPVLIGLAFGTAVAGQWGMAYRIIAAPLAFISLPLGNVLTNEASRDHDDARLFALGRKVFVAALVLVAIPLLLFAGVAPNFTSLVLGPHWVATGEFAAALAILGAAQAVTTPFQELTSIYRIPALRFVCEFTTAVLVLSPFALQRVAGWSALTTVWVMSIGGAVGALCGFALVCVVLLRIHARMTAVATRRA